jgi:RND superfamily putative drug exporter
MFDRWGQFVVRVWPVMLIGWLLALLAAIAAAPPLESVVQTGEFAFLPADSPSRVGERAFAQSFPEHSRASTIAVIVRRPGPGEHLTDEDLNFVDDDLDEGDPETEFELKERLRRLLPEELEVRGEDEAAEAASPVLTFRDKSTGRFLISPDRQATLVLIELQAEFLDTKNAPLIRAIEELLFEDEEFRQHVPQGLELALSGTAVVGRDMLRAAKESAKSTEKWTIILVVLLLLSIYRAPFLWLVPLSTVFAAVLLTMKLLCLAAERGWVVLFSGIESYVTVLLYGAGVDYCLFLIARYKEEVDQGIGSRQAVRDALGRVGAAIAASAGTVICGIGMMAFAEFGKFHEAGIAISFGLMIVLLAALSFTPALLTLMGQWVFWQPNWSALRGKLLAPFHWANGPVEPQPGALDPEAHQGWLQSLWDRVGAALLRRPFSIWAVSVLIMLPFAIVGVANYTHLSYGLLSDLPATARSVVGTNIVQRHFPAGTTGPITALIHSDQLDFTQLDGESGGVAVINSLTLGLRERAEDLLLSDVRSVSHPLGGDESLSTVTNPARRRIMTARAIQHYVSQVEGFGEHWTRVELTANIDPFSRDSIEHLTRLELELHRLLPPSTTLYLLGPTASIRDLKNVTDRDQVRIDLLVIAGVFTILVMLLRQPGICSYLIISVLFSYLATLGVTYLVYWWYDGAAFAGLDWKVPMFLFTILIAVGEDYNIFLMSRIEEEQVVHGPVEGVIQALSKTGRIISSCGIIMAGTFASLAAGTLKGMSQLGFALAFGVLLDTFVVRPVLVPAYLVLLHSGRLGPLGRWLGAKTLPAETASAVTAGTTNT